MHLLLTSPLLAWLVANLGVASGEKSSSFCSDSSWEIEWSDEFNADELDTTKWGPVITSALPHRLPRANSVPPQHNTALSRERKGRYGADCSGAGCITLGACREAACTRANTFTGNGSLTLISKYETIVEGFNYTTGAVSTWDRAAWRPSDGTFRVCIRAKLPGHNRVGQSQGIWPAHWMMPHDSSCDPDKGEMDIMEMVNGNGDYEATYHWQTTFPQTNCSYPIGHEHQYCHKRFTTWNSDFHEYAVERGLNHVAFALDDEVMLNITREMTPTPVFWDVPFYLILNTAIGGGWPGPPNASTVWPIEHTIDYVRVARQMRHF